MPTLVQRPSTGSTQKAAADAPRKRRPLPRWKIALAVVIALVLHVALILLLAWALPHWPRPPLRKGTAAAPIQLMLQPAEPTPTPGLHPTEVVPPKPPEYIRTPDANKSDTPPPDPEFISSDHTLPDAAKPPEDKTKPLPTQDGKEMTAFDFETNPYIAGQEAHDTASVAAQPDAPAPTPPPVNPKSAAQETPTPPPPSAQSTPPLPGDFLTMRSADASPSNTPPEPSPSPTAKPTPNVQDALAAQAARVRRENPSVNSHSIVQPPGYQPQTVQTKMSGGIDSRTGKASVAALGTPLGRYEKAVGDAIGARWYFLVNDKMSTLVRTSEVKIHFVVTRSGQIINTRVSGPNTNTALADISLEAVTNAEVPPIPSDVVALLPEGQLEGDFAFSFFE